VHHEKRIPRKGVTTNYSFGLHRVDSLSYTPTCLSTMRFFGVVSNDTRATTVAIGSMLLFGCLISRVEGFQSRSSPRQQHHAFIPNAAKPIASTSPLSYLPWTITIRPPNCGTLRKMTNPHILSNAKCARHRITPHFMADVTGTLSVDGGSKQGLLQKVRGTYV
jgi:hypothetical protein